MQCFPSETIIKFVKRWANSIYLKYGTNVIRQKNVPKGVLKQKYLPLEPATSFRDFHKLLLWVDTY